MHQLVQDHSSVLTAGLIIKGNNFLDSTVRVLLFSRELFPLLTFVTDNTEKKVREEEDSFELNFLTVAWCWKCMCKVETIIWWEIHSPCHLKKKKKKKGIILSNTCNFPIKPWLIHPFHRYQYRRICDQICTNVNLMVWEIRIQKTKLGVNFLFNLNY